MADKKISALTGATTPLAGTEVLPIVQGGATVKVSVDNLTAGKPVSMSNLTYTGTATGGTGVINIGSGQVYKDVSGNVGIGTVAPVYKLNVAASDITNIVGGSAAAINITNTDAGAFGRTADLDFSIGGGAVSEKIAGLSAIFTNFSSSVGGALAFCTNNGSGSFAEGMRLHSSRGVSIGNTTDPGATNLSVSGNVVIATAGKGVTDSTGGTTLNFTSTGITSNSQFTALRFNSLSGVTPSTASGAAATIFTTSGDQVWIVNAAVTGTGAPATYVASAIVKSSGNAVVTALSSATNLTITASGANIQVTQTSGVAQVMVYTATRLF